MDNSELLNHSKKWDRSGIVVSTLCLIHCLALPFLFAFIPTFNELHKNPILEIILLLIAIIVGCVSFITSYKKHRMIQPLLLGFFGIFLLVANLSFDILNPDDHMVLHRFLVNPLMIFGGLCLFFGHMWNIHACHCFCDRDCSHEEHQGHDLHEQHIHNEQHKHHNH
jgi:hypothetical protein